MPQKKKLSDAKSEREEAKWFEENEDRLLKLFEQAAKDGSLRVGARSVGISISKNDETLRKPPSQKVMLRIATEDVERARRLAADRGTGYQTYIKMLLHAGLDRAERVSR